MNKQQHALHTVAMATCLTVACIQTAIKFVDSLVRREVSQHAGEFLDFMIDNGYCKISSDGLNLKFAKVATACMLYTCVCVCVCVSLFNKQSAFVDDAYRIDRN
jgi:hypothetical protein